jgi:Fe2+ or Zn2+ uptake regulation protein
MKKPSCYKRLYAEHARECQVCGHGEVCSAYREIRITRRNQQHIAIQQILLKGKLTFEALNAEVMARFPGKLINVYNCLNELKHQGIVRVEAAGRTRFYKLR